MGETVELTLTVSQENTINLLVKILNGDCDAAVALAEEVHRDVVCTDAGIENLPDLVMFNFQMHISIAKCVKSNKNYLSIFVQQPDIMDLSAVGIWIDPIGLNFFSNPMK